MTARTHIYLYIYIFVHTHICFVYVHINATKRYYEPKQVPFEDPSIYTDYVHEYILCICSISVIINVKYAHRQATIPSMNGTLVPQASAQRVVEGGWCSLRLGLLVEPWWF